MNLKFKNFFLKKNSLALLGGEPVLKKDLKLYKTIGFGEKKVISKLMNKGKLSGFVGAWCDDFYGGPMVRELEDRWKDIFKCKNAVSVNSNTSGLIAALGAIGLSPGDEVIVPPMTMSATVMAPLIYGGIPVFVDIENSFFCLDINKVEKAITEKTKAILAVNLFGHPAKLRELRALADKNNIFLIEDAAQCPLATEYGKYAGTIGHIGVFSLNYHKHIHTGEGGICCTNDEDLALKMQAIRNHGENIVKPLQIKNPVNFVGFNFRMTELSAAIGIEQLKKISKFVSNREKIANKLTTSLSGLDGLSTPEVRSECRHVYYVWSAKFEAKSIELPRKLIAKALQAEGLPVAEGYAEPLYLLPAFSERIAIGRNGWPFTLTDRKYERGLCPIAEELYMNSLLEFCICSYQLDKKELNDSIDAFQKVFDNLDKLKDFSYNGNLK